MNSCRCKLSWMGSSTTRFWTRTSSSQLVIWSLGDVSPSNKTTTTNIQHGRQRGGRSRLQESEVAGVAQSKTKHHPIENLWRQLKIAVHHRSPKNLQELEQYFQREWHKIPADVCAKLVESYSGRLLSMLFKYCFEVLNIQHPECPPLHQTGWISLIGQALWEKT